MEQIGLLLRDQKKTVSRDEAFARAEDSEAKLAVITDWVKSVKGLS